MLLLEDRTHKVALSPELVLRKVVLIPPKPASPTRPGPSNWSVVVEHSDGSETFTYPTEDEAQETFDKATGGGKTTSSYTRQQSKS